MFSVILAADENGGIGSSNNLPWRIKADMNYFKKVTTETAESNQQNIVIMGRKTWESIPKKFRPLPDRLNIVITRNKTFSIPADVLLASSLEDALEKASNMIHIHKTFVIGGAQVYNEAMNRDDCEEIYLTRIHNKFECDTFVSDPSSDFVLKSVSVQEEKDLKFSFEYFARK